jgi:hypothetical protein
VDGSVVEEVIAFGMVENTMGDRKRVIKAAREVPLDEIREFLQKDDDLVDDYFLVYHRELDWWEICRWSRTNGRMSMTIEDGPFEYAVLDYMKNHGYLQFESDAEATTHIQAMGWTCSRTSMAECE